jgi:hypothetical protein
MGFSYSQYSRFPHMGQPASTTGSNKFELELELDALDPLDECELLECEELECELLEWLLDDTELELEWLELMLGAMNLND